jgi:hypothetical protein
VGTVASGCIGVASGKRLLDCGKVLIMGRLQGPFGGDEWGMEAEPRRLRELLVQPWS